MSGTVVRLLLLVALCVPLLGASAGCSLVRVDPIVAEERSVVATTDPARILTLKEPGVWLNGPTSTATKGIRLPAGQYILEAEDGDFLYFRAPAPIGMRRLQRGQTLDGPDMPGGLALHKKIPLFPAAATYVDVSPGRKMLVFEHGSEFLRERGTLWETTF